MESSFIFFQTRKNQGYDLAWVGVVIITVIHYHTHIHPLLSKSKTKGWVGVSVVSTYTHAHPIFTIQMLINNAKVI
jgi:hypothetical protein